MWKTMTFEWEKYRYGFRCEKQWVLNKKNRDLVLDVKKNEFLMRKYRSDFICESNELLMRK